MNLPLNFTSTTTKNGLNMNKTVLKSQEYKNSIFTKFREEVTKQKARIETELQKAKEIREKYNPRKNCGNSKKDESISLSCNQKSAKESHSNSIKNIKHVRYKSDNLITPSKPVNDLLNFNNTSENKIFETGLPFERLTSDDLKNFIRSKDKKVTSYTSGIFLKKNLSSKNIRNPLKHKTDSFKTLDKKKLCNISKKLKIKNNMFRVKEFKVKYIDNWHLKHGFPELKLIPNVASNMEFQSSLISDELNVLLENIQHFKMTFLHNKELFDIFQSLENKKQININKILEESCGLMMEISNDILLDFAQYLEKFASIQPPRPEKLKIKAVKNEEQTFISNVNLFTEISSFLKGSFEVYSLLIKQVEDMKLPVNQFMKVVQFLARCRLNVSNLIYTTKNYQNNYQNDIKLFSKYQENKVSEEKNDKSYHITSKVNLKSHIIKNLDLIEKIKQQFDFKANEVTSRIRRLNNVLTKY